jgi:predicted PurR-regulated permease PerM
MKELGQHPSRFVTGLFLLVFALAIAFFLRMVLVFFTAVILALVLASLFWPAFERLLSWVGGRRGVAAGLSLGLVVAVVVVPVAGVLTSLSSEAVGLYEKTSSDRALLAQMRALLSRDSAMVVRVQDLASRLGVDLSPATLGEHIATLGSSVGLFLYEQIGGAAQNVFALVLHFAMMLILLFAFFSEGPRLKAYLLELSPLPDDEEETLAARFGAISRAVFLGNGLASVLQGAIGGLSFYVFGLGSGILWGSMIAFFAFLPMVGGSIILVPAAVYLFLTGHTGLAVGFVIFNAVQVGILEYVVKPRFISGPIQLNGILVFFSVVAGISVFGLLGLFYGPLIITMVLTLAEIYRAHYRSSLLTARELAELTPARGPVEPEVGIELGESAS